MPRHRPAVIMAYEALATDDAGRMCRDISDEACREQPENFLRHAVALGLSKTADGLSSSKLILPWVMTHLGVPPALIGLLVPIREAGALLPQLFTAATIRGLPQRKWAWAGGAIGEGIGAGIMFLSAFFLSGFLAGLGILAGLAVLALSRSVCSVAYKDVLGKTIGRGQRGTVVGVAATGAAAAMILFSFLLIGLSAQRAVIVMVALALASMAWITAGMLFATMAEDRGAQEGGANGWRAALTHLHWLRKDPQLTRFILARGLLTSTALAPPYIVILASGESGNALEGLGALVLASAIAGVASSYVWGRLADRSARQVLILTGFLGAAAMGLSVFFASVGLGGSLLAMPLALFFLMVAHQGVRLGRSTYLVDMVGEDRRAIYTAIANTVIGLVLLTSAVFGGIASLYGAHVTLMVFAGMAITASAVAWTLKELGDGTPAAPAD
ncbi:MAG: MFS transporter [Roseinatronobacter sp.]